MLRKIFSVILGYAIFVISSVLLFRISGQAPHGEASIGFKILTMAYGFVFSFLSGLVVPLIAKVKTLSMNYILAVVLIGFAAFSMFKSDGEHWTQLFAIFIFGPASILGGWFMIRRKK